MKKVLLVSAALIFISSVAFAQNNCYIGIVGDDGYGQAPYDTHCVSAMISPLVIVTLGDSEGFLGGEFKVVYPSNVNPFSPAYNDDLVLTDGTLDAGFTFSYTNCQTGWNWIAKQDIYIMTTDCTTIELGPYPESGLLRLTRCDAPDYTKFFPTVWCHLYINCCPPEDPTATEEKSWGAIKSMFE